MGFFLGGVLVVVVVVVVVALMVGGLRIISARQGLRLGV